MCCFYFGFCIGYGITVFIGNNDLDVTFSIIVNALKGVIAPRRPLREAICIHGYRHIFNRDAAPKVYNFKSAYFNCLKLKAKSYIKACISVYKGCGSIHLCPLVTYHNGLLNYFFISSRRTVLFDYKLNFAYISLARATNVSLNKQCVACRCLTKQSSVSATKLISVGCGRHRCNVNSDCLRKG